MRKKLLILVRLYLPFLFLSFSSSLYAIPIISSFSPIAARSGQTVTISGTGFDPVPTNNIVYFGVIRGTVTGGTTNTITVTVPTGATYDPISVTVAGFTGYSRLPFTLTFSVVSSDFTPATFSNRTDIWVGGYTGTTPSDFDNDEKIDISICNGYYVNIHRNTSSSGNISFASALSFDALKVMYGNVSADFDGDGLQDQAVTKASSSSFEYSLGDLSVFRNTTSGGVIALSSRIDLFTANPGWDWYGLAAGDLDGDGRPDLIMSNNSSSGTIAVFRNTSTIGNLSFANPVYYTTGNSPRAVSMGDLDSDGKPDIVVANQGSASISIFKNSSSVGSISLARTDQALLAGLAPEKAVLVDLDVDGHLDIAVPDHYSATLQDGSLSIFRNNGVTGAISLATRVDMMTPGHPWGIAASDLNGDGKPDLAVTNYWQANSLMLYKNVSSPGVITLIKQVTYTDLMGARDVVAADLNGDMSAELIVRNINTQTIAILRNDIELMPLPLKLIEFSGKLREQRVDLHWKTADEINTDRFEIERSTTANNFSSIGEVAAFSSSTTIKNYSFTDFQPLPNTSYYRLKIIDKDTHTSYSSVISVRRINKGILFIIPNPASDQILITHPKATNNRLMITDINGRILQTYSPQNNADRSTIDISKLSAGVYTVIFSTAGETVTTKLIIAR